MTIKRKTALFLFGATYALQMIAFAIIGLLAQRSYAALLLQGVEDPGLIYISTGSFIAAVITLVIMGVVVFEISKEGISLNVNTGSE